MPHQSWQQEHFSLAYVRAVAATAGFGVEPHDNDVDGVDLTICAYGLGGTVRSPRLDVQVKSETSGQPKKFPFKHALKVANYENLRHVDYLAPRVLVVVAMPADVTDWVKQGPKALAMHHAAYWASLRGKPATTNAKTVTVSLPKKQRFTVDELQRLMLEIGKGNPP